MPRSSSATTGSRLTPFLQSIRVVSRLFTPVSPEFRFCRDDESPSANIERDLHSSLDCRDDSLCVLILALPKDCVVSVKENFGSWNFGSSKHSKLSENSNRGLWLEGEGFVEE